MGLSFLAPTTPEPVRWDPFQPVDQHLSDRVFFNLSQRKAPAAA